MNELPSGLSLLSVEKSTVGLDMTIGRADTGAPVVYVKGCNPEAANTVAIGIYAPSSPVRPWNRVVHRRMRAAAEEFTRLVLEAIPANLNWFSWKASLQEMPERCIATLRVDPNSPMFTAFKYDIKDGEFFLTSEFDPSDEDDLAIEHLVSAIKVAWDQVADQF